MKPYGFAAVCARICSAALVWMLALAPVPAAATSAAPMPVIGLSVARADGISIPGFKAFADSHSYQVGVGITFPGGFFPKGKLYVGLILPGGQEAYTWVDEGGVPRLQRGLAPLLTGLDMSVGKTLDLHSLYERALTHAFAPDAPRGMYLVFAVIVVGDLPPADVLGWYGVEMQPLFVE